MQIAYEEAWLAPFKACLSESDKCVCRVALLIGAFRGRRQRICFPSSGNRKATLHIRTQPTQMLVEAVN